MNPTKLNLSKYLRENINTPIVRGHLFESVRNRDIEKALTAIESFLKKRKVYTIPAIESSTVDSADSFVVHCFTDSGKGCSLVWSSSDTSELHSILFTANFDKTYSDIMMGKTTVYDVEVALKGASIVRAIQLVADVMNGRVAMDKMALNKAIRDAQIWEALDQDELDMLLEASKDPIIADLEKKRSVIYHRIRSWEKQGKDVTGLQKEYDDLKNQLSDARASVRSNISLTPVEDPTLKRMEDRFEEEERALPEERFSDMESYVQNVILGLDVCALICGAPGVGKTYRIMQAIKKEGKRRGIDYEVIKGKATPMALYTLLHDYQKEGQLLIIDDADSIIKDDVMINLIKAATDSSDERIVAYASSAAPIAPEEKLGMYDDFEQDAKGIWRYPKNFEYNGGVIIITNMNAGQIDTAIRSRALICDLNFTTAEVLDLVRSLSPHIAPEILSPEAKERALHYLEELADSGAPMEISIRSFTLCAKQYMSNAPEKAIERRIKEQMKLKFLRGGKKY